MTPLPLLRSAWLAFLRFEFRALAVLLPVAILELALVDALEAHLPWPLGLAGAGAVALAPGAWRFAGEIT